MEYNYLRNAHMERSIAEEFLKNQRFSFVVLDSNIHQNGQLHVYVPFRIHILVLTWLTN